MGGSSSKENEIKAPKVDFNAAKFDASYVQQLQKEAADQVKKATDQIQANSTWWTRFWVYVVFVGIGIVALVFFGIFIRDSLGTVYGWSPWIFFKSGGGNVGPSNNTSLFVDTATYGTSKASADVTAYLRGKIQNSMTLPSFTVGYANVGLSSDPDPAGGNTLTVTWYVGYNSATTTTVSEGGQFPTLPTPSSVSSTASSISSFFSGIFGASSLAPPHEATTPATIPASKAPISDAHGGYGIQWWMFIQDWNYGYGKEKSVLKRTDTTNAAISNPSVTLHPTDNTLRVTVSIFPSSQGGAGKTVPAPAGNSGATDDVYTCEIPNIPLQTWFSVSVTVFDRNLDVYIDGKLVKSVFLPGVPKPAAGDIQLSPGGGFSGNICTIQHVDRMLTPGDALNFWSTGTACSSTKKSSPIKSATGYSINFGVYDKSGTQVQKYTF